MLYRLALSAVAEALEEVVYNFLVELVGIDQPIRIVGASCRVGGGSLVAMSEISTLSSEVGVEDCQSFFFVAHMDHA